MPADLDRFVEKQVKHGGFSTASEYVRHLVRGDQEREAALRLEAKLLEALDSSDFSEVTPAMFERLRERVQRVQRSGKATKPRSA